MKGAATSSCGIEAGAHDAGPGSPASRRPACSSSAQVGSSRRRLHRVRRLGPEPRRTVRFSSRRHAARPCAIAISSLAPARPHSVHGARRGRAGRSTRERSATSLARTCRTAPSSSLKSAASGSSPRSADRCPARAAGEGHLQQRDEQAAVGAVVVGEELAVGRQLLDRREEALAGAPGRRDPAARRRAGRRPAPAPSRPGGSCPRPDRRAAARSRPTSRAQLRRERAAHVGDRREGAHDQRERRGHALLAGRPPPRPCAWTSSPCRRGWRCRAPGHSSTPTARTAS